MANLYNCPSSVYESILCNRTVLLRAIKHLGPSRVQWSGKSSPSTATYAYERHACCWELDGRPAKILDILTQAILFGVKFSTQEWKEVYELAPSIRKLPVNHISSS